MGRMGVIDLGTNTFHLLVAEKGPNGFVPIFRQRFFVKLAENGIEQIGKAPFERGLQVMQTYREKLDELEVEEVRAVGTAALRTASNGPEFVETVLTNTGIQIELIDGLQEAHFIHQGVQQAVDFSGGPKLIMDIGGGSVEFIIADGEKVYWAKSFPVGVAVLYKQFHHSEPIHPSEVEAIVQFLMGHFDSLQKAIREFEPKDLVGASGTFDVLENLLGTKIENGKVARVPFDQFTPLYEKMLQLDPDQRRAIDGVPESRVDMIVVALLLIKTVLDLLQPGQILVSAFAMKEGILMSMSE